MEPDRLYGSQRIVARRLYEATKPTVPWDKLGPGQRRPFIDQSCEPPYDTEGMG